MRRIGIYYAYWTSEWESDFLPFIPKVKQLGFDQLEIHAGAVSKMSKSDLDTLSKAAKDENIYLSYGIGLTKENDVSSVNEDTRKNGIAFMRKAIEAVGYMGGGNIGGTVHSYWPAIPEDGVDKKNVYKQSIKSMRELVKIASDNNVVLNVEVINRFEQFLLNTCQEALEYVTEIDSPNCRILLDTFHMNIEEESIGGAIKSAGKYLSELHIGETNRVPPGKGRMPWKEIADALNAISFDGSLVVEAFVMPGGQVGRDIGIWREIVKNPDLDKMAMESVQFIKNNLL